MKFFKKIIFILLLVVTLFSCSNEDSNNTNINVVESKELTIFHINDPHGQIANFSKIKYIIDQEKAQTNVVVVCAGDIFSGNPVVDNYSEKGFPMIDLMNKVGFDISVIGNHEFDYGQTVLKNRLNQSQFDWVCANVTMNNTGIPEPFEYKTITKSNVKITFLGLVETNGKDGDVIPSTHPWRVQNITFQPYASVVSKYNKLKETENADLYIALTHLGGNADNYLATNFPYFDLIIGGHSHTIVNQKVNQIPIYQAGSNLNYLGKITLKIKDKKIESTQYELIDLATYPNHNTTLKEEINTYNQNANLDEIIGYASAYHTRNAVGSFYTDALKNELNVDISIQNTGGIRSDLNEGTITKREIYSIDPFNNGSVVYTLTVQEIKDFLTESKAAIYYSGIKIEQINNSIQISKNNQILANNQYLTIGLNDYIPAVYNQYFTQTPMLKPFTTAENIIHYLEKNSANINYTQTNNFFQFQ
jgi:2',3'-cyclic-nucleotide 2'-phosphodiesterase (5'-nucleotidase family)